MTQQIPGDLMPQFAAAIALAAQYDQPAYVLAPEGQQLAMAVLWAAILPVHRARIMAMILPDGTVFERAPASVE